MFTSNHCLIQEEWLSSPTSLHRILRATACFCAKLVASGSVAAMNFAHERACTRNMIVSQIPLLVHRFFDYDATVNISQIKRLCKAGFRTEKDAMPEVISIKTVIHLVKEVDASTALKFSSITTYSNRSDRRINVYKCDRAPRAWSK